MGKLIRRSRTLGFRPRRRHSMTRAPSWLSWFEPERRRIRPRENALPTQNDIERRIEEAFGEGVRFTTPSPERVQQAVDEEFGKLAGVSQMRQPQPSIAESSSEVALAKRRRIEEVRRR